MKFSYSWLQSFFDEKLPEPEILEKKISLYSFEPEGLDKINGDTILDFDILPNRAHDCLCHKGLAKEIQALFGIRIKQDRYAKIPKEIKKSDLELTIDIQNTNNCRRYSGRIIEGIKIGPSPEWLKQRLESIGQRSINNVVDATNYIMFDLGQPLHAFDYTKISGKNIIIRNAEDSETVSLLGGEEKTLPEGTLVIADTKGVLAVAGIKGGQKATVDENTTNIVLESANFEPVSTRKSSRKIKIQTDSSKRFENETTPEWTEPSIEACTQLILEIAGNKETKIGLITDSYPKHITPKKILLSSNKTNETLGLSLSISDMSFILSRLELKHTEQEGFFSVEIPTERIDLNTPEDLVEEIARINGYENVPTILPNNPHITIHPETYYTQKIRNWLTKEGFHEVMTHTFVNRGKIEMANALASNKNFLRTELVDGFIESLSKNVKNAELFGSESLKQFEIGVVFPNEKQETHLALGFSSNKKKEKLDLKKILNDLGKAIGLDLSEHKETKDGMAIETNLSSVIPNETKNNYENAEIILSSDNRSFTGFSVFPFITRDIAVWIPTETESSELEKILIKNNGDLLVNAPRLFDKFSKEGKTSYAYRLVFQSREKTLTDEEINKMMAKITEKIEELGWEIR